MGFIQEAGIAAPLTKAEKPTEFRRVLDALETLEIAAFGLNSHVVEIEQAVVGAAQSEGFVLPDEHPSTLAEAHSRIANATAAIERATQFLNRFF